ncbi:HypC/HybG/HupF family hydrogenase formation chaperone [bacterium]|nr:HypC/HybG/HupF family hydrogenase formation chaperone [bacterium]
MCLAIPGRIEEIDRRGPMTMAKVNFDGVNKDVCIEWVQEANVGDYVIVHAGFAINILDKQEAIENLKLIKEAINLPGVYNKW